VVDDVHWADEPSLRFLGYLAPRLEDLHILVLAASRPPLDHGYENLIEAVIELWQHLGASDPDR
jgi:predicted ATPase